MTAVPIGDIVPRTQRIGPPEPLGRTNARYMTGVQGEVWQAHGGDTAITEHGQGFVGNDTRGDAIRAVIRSNQKAAEDALRRGNVKEALSLLRANEGLWAQYEECDANEDWHLAEIVSAAGLNLTHLRAAAVTISAMLAAGG